VTEVAAPSRKFRRLVVGRPMQTEELEETLLPKFLALPIFASDPLSSVAYATESALVVLVGVAGLSAAHLVFPISLAIGLLLAIVVVSYMQTVLAYETSGGASGRGILTLKSGCDAVGLEGAGGIPWGVEAWAPKMRTTKVRTRKISIGRKKS